MKYISVTIILSLLSIGVSAQEVYHKEMSTQELTEDFQLFASTIQAIHPNLYLYTPKTKSDSLLAAIENDLNKAMSPIDFFRKLTSFVHSIRNAHTTIRPPEAYIDHVNSQAKKLPLKFLYRNDSLVVVENLSDHLNISVGTVVTKINGSSITGLMDEMAEFTFVDGFNDNYSNYLSSQFFNKRHAFAIGLPDNYEIEYIDAQGNPVTEILKAIQLNEDSLKANRVQEKPYAFHIADHTAFLTIKSFSKISLKAFRKFLKKSFAEIKEKNIKQLIVDLRDNRGGIQEASNELLSCFIDKTIYPIKLKYAIVEELPNQEFFTKDYIFSYFHKEKFQKSEDIFLVTTDAKVVVKPKRIPYKDRLVFLINENCASSTTSFLGQIKTHRKDALFIGRETLGNPAIVVADFVVSLVLPHSKITVKIPLINSEKNVGFENPKRGVLPDFEVLPTIEEVLNQRDRIMEKALKVVNGN